MKVKVGNKIYDSEEEPIMVVLSKEDKNNIANMKEETTKYCSYPDDPQWLEDTYKKIIEWMHECDDLL